MKSRRAVHAAWLVLLIGVALPAWAADPSKPASSGPAAKQALKAPIKLDAKSLPKKKIPSLQQRDAVDRAYDDFRQKYDATLAAIKRYERNEAECRSRTYSIADQRAAGCSESDTLRACNVKLFNHCANYNQDAPGGVIWTQMQMSAVTLRQKVQEFSNHPGTGRQSKK